MKKFKTQEIRDLLNQVYHEEISPSRMVEILNEMVSEVEKPNFKEGDFLHSDWYDENITIIFKNRVGDNLYYHASKSRYLGVLVDDGCCWGDGSDFRIATEEEKQELLDALAKEGKRWNAEKLEIEGIPQCKFKEGDFVYEDERIIIVKSCPNMYHAIMWHTHSYSPNYNGTYAVDFSEPTFRYATEEEKQILIDAMRKGGKRWNAEKMCVEDIPKRKFQKGEKVRIKDGVSSKTVSGENLSFNSMMDDLIGTTMTVSRYIYESVCVVCNESDWRFHEDWLEPCIEELKEGDLAIFWDDDKKYAVIKFYERSGGSEEEYFRHRDHNGSGWKNVIKFESVEQYERFIKGEI